MKIKKPPRLINGQYDPRELQRYLDGVSDGTLVNEILAADTGVSITHSTTTGKITIAFDSADAVTNATASSVSVDTADADSTYGAPEATLINELKDDVNQLVTDLNAVVTQLNALLASLRAKNIIST